MNRPVSDQKLIIITKKKQHQESNGARKNKKVKHDTSFISSKYKTKQFKKNNFELEILL